MHIKDVIKFAADAHQGQTRRFTGRPYIVHPVSVYRRLKKFGVTDQDVLTAAINHDTVEDTEVTLSSLAKIFNPKVAEIVSWLTNPGGGKTEKSAHIKHIIKSAPYEVVLIKIFDRIDNLLGGNDEKFREKYKPDTFMMLQELRKRNWSRLTNEFEQTILDVYGTLPD